MMWCAKDRGSLTPVNILSTWTATLSKSKTRHAEVYHLAERYMHSLNYGICHGAWAEWYAAQSKISTLLTRLAEGGDNCQEGRDIEQVAQMVNYVELGSFWTKRFFTSRGYFGNGHYLAREGDVICNIIFGCCRPFILRKTGQTCQRSSRGCRLYRLIGPAYIPGTRRLPHISGIGFCYPILGHEHSKDWVDWGLQEEDIHIC